MATYSNESGGSIISIIVLLVIVIFIFKGIDSKEPEFKTMRYDGCEYVYRQSGYKLGLSHKGNCDNHRDF